MTVLEQDARDRKVDPDAPEYDVVSDTDYLNPVLVCRPISRGIKLGVRHSRCITRAHPQLRNWDGTLSSYCEIQFENFCSRMAYGLRTHNRDHPDDQMTVIDPVELVQQHPDNLDAPLAYGVNCFQALNVCVRTLRLYAIDYTYTWPEEEDLKTPWKNPGSSLEATSRRRWIAQHNSGSIAVASYNQFRIESRLLADYSWMNKAFQLWNQSIDDMKQDIEQGQWPGHMRMPITTPI